MLFFSDLDIAQKWEEIFFIYFSIFYFDSALQDGKIHFKPKCFFCSYAYLQKSINVDQMGTWLPSYNVCNEQR